jgi:hypothetical protein
MRLLVSLRVSRFIILLLVGALAACAGDATNAEDGGTASAEAVPADPASPDAAAAEPTGDNEGPPPRWILDANATPRGLLRNEAGATPGYVLFAPFQSELTYLVDTQGRVVHTWANGRAPNFQYLQGDGSLVRLARIAEPPNFRAGGVAGYLQRLSWVGDVLWEWRLGDEQRMLHHDIEVLPNGNILAIAYEQKNPEEARAAGRRVDLIPEQGLWSEWILEIEPLPPDGARIVWEWHVWDHLVQEHDPEAANYGAPADHPRRFDINADAGESMVDEEELAQLQALGYVPDSATPEDLASDFLHMNAIEYHAGLDQIAVSLPGISEIWIIDHATTTAEAATSSGGRSGHGGDLLYRWGNPANYGRGDAADQRLFSQHDILWIPEGMANAGNLTVFDNGSGRPDGEYSSVLEWTPPVDGSGSYSFGEGGAFGPDEMVWRYVTEDDPGGFFSPFVSGAHRLAGGNTFIISGAQGRLFEVTPEGAIVWEYRNPFHGELEGWTPAATEQTPYGLFRATKIAPDHPGLAGRALAPLDPQPEAYDAPPGRPSGGSPIQPPASAPPSPSTAAAAPSCSTCSMVSNSSAASSGLGT